jgi:hypothetical protein
MTNKDCGIASLEHAAKIWGVDISRSIPRAFRNSASSLASLSTLAQRHGFHAFVLQASSKGEGPFKEITGHLINERPLIILLRVPSTFSAMFKYVWQSRKSPEFAGDSTHWLRHFVVLTKAEKIGRDGIARKFTMMDPAKGENRTVGLGGLDLFWRRQDAKYLLLSK